MLNLRKSLTRFSKLALAAVIAVPALAVTMPALAAPGDGTSKGKIEFTNDTTNIKPVNPVDPTDPKNPPTDPGVIDPIPVEKGLAMIYIPNLDFGKNDIQDSDMEYFETHLGTDTADVQVADFRAAAAGKKWVLSAKMSKFQTTASTPVDTLNGAVLSLDGGTVAGAQGAGGLATDITVTNNATITSGAASATKLAEADEDVSGLWVLRWMDGANGEGSDKTIFDAVKYAPQKSGTEKRNGKVKLKVFRGTATGGEATSTITWTLSNV